MANKSFKTIEEQISILQSRGLKIPDYNSAKLFLLRNNYYRVSGYSLTLRNHDVFYPNATFQNIVDIYSFDHELRHILFHYIEQIEVSLKSLYAYEFTKIHGATGYLNSQNFLDTAGYMRIISEGNKLRDKRRSHEAYIKHFMDDLHQNLPLWAYVDLLTFSNISSLYSISEPFIKKSVAAHYGLTMNTADKLLGNFMHSLTILRNLCAHGSRLFNRLFEQKPSLNKKEQALLIEKPDSTIDNAHLYGFILIMRRLLAPKEFAEMKQSIIVLNNKYPFVSMRYYGFRDDWMEKL